jgi:hypothetical protein
MYRFLQPPPDVTLGPTSYTDTRTIWNADIHLNCTYCFLSNDEADLFAKNEQKYLFKQIYEKPYYNVTGQNRINLDSIGMVISWMFYFQRSDANLRNQWSNYTNWPYNYMPQDVTPAPTAGNYPNPAPSPPNPALLGPGLNPDGSLSGLFTTGVFNPQNIQYILVALGILLDGQYRENVLPSGVYNFVEKYTRTAGFAPPGLYCYNFCLNTDPFEYQPSGAINLSKFRIIELEVSTHVPPFDVQNMSYNIICDANGNPIGTSKLNWRLLHILHDSLAPFQHRSIYRNSSLRFRCFSYGRPLHQFFCRLRRFQSKHQKSSNFQGCRCRCLSYKLLWFQVQMFLQSMAPKVWWHLLNLEL